MSTPASVHMSLVARLQDHLVTEGYSKSVQLQYPTLACHFVEFCAREHLALEVVRQDHVTKFLRVQHRSFLQRNTDSPPFSQWCWRYTCALHMLLRLVHGKWPVDEPPATELEAFHCGLVHDYDIWLRDHRGLQPQTRTKRRLHALRFLSWLGAHADEQNVASLSVGAVDAYVQQSCEGRRRTSIEDITVCLRDLLRYLYRSGQSKTDLTGMVTGPRIYDHEEIPSALSAEHVQRVLEVSRQDSSPTGLRDYAILLLLSTYGLRAAEIINLRLEDIDWKLDVLHVCHTKTGAHSELPLLREPGEAMLRYLEHGRPPSAHRELFLRIYAPHRPFKSGSNLNCVTSARLKAAGIVPQGHHGPHAFRHARAVSLLRFGVPLKVIGDVLGHASASSTGVYLKLATEDLRTIGLELPSGVSP